MMRPGFHHVWQDAGNSDAELQADVMRFVAIVALCIVAISSLVDEADTSQPVVEEPAPRVEEIQQPTQERVFEPVAKTPLASTAIPANKRTDPPMVAAPPVPPPKSALVRTRGAVAITSPAVQVPPEPEPVKAVETPQQAQPPVPKKGFTLRFESDTALLKMVEAGRVSLFVFGEEKTLKLSFGQAGPRFRSAAQPRQFHAITPDTVPVTLQVALSDAGYTAADVVWGVTLPPSTRSTLTGILRTHDGGELIIRANGEVYLENNDV
jgi:hypothetical protein